MVRDKELLKEREKETALVKRQIESQRRENIELSRRLQKKKGEEVELENKKNESERSIQIVYHEESFKNHKLELDLHHLSNSTNITQQENIGAMVQKVQEIQVSIQKTGKQHFKASVDGNKMQRLQEIMQKIQIRQQKSSQGEQQMEKLESELAEMEGQLRMKKIDIQDLEQQHSMVAKEKELVTSCEAQMTTKLAMMKGFNEDYFDIIKQNKRDIEFKSYS